MIVPYGHVLALAAVVFSLGLACVLTRRNLIMTLIGVEILMNAAAIAFVGSALYRHSLEGQAFVLFLIAVAAAEVSVGLVLAVGAWRHSGTVDPDEYRTLEG
ncbi:MAG: NADH-quinone oxidoreductase subunit NuoK [Thermodesulfobacteriota bacterium]